MKKILIVEDDQVLSKTIETKVTNMGYEALKAMDGDKALKLLNDEKPNLIILDLLMPEMDGYQFLKEVKSTQHKEIPVLVLTSISNESDLKHAVELGAEDFLIKSDVTLEYLMIRIKNLLGD